MTLEPELKKCTSTRSKNANHEIKSGDGRNSSIRLVSISAGSPIKPVDDGSIHIEVPPGILAPSAKSSVHSRECQQSKWTLDEPEMRSPSLTPIDNIAPVRLDDDDWIWSDAGDSSFSFDGHSPPGSILDVPLPTSLHDVNSATDSQSKNGKSDEFSLHSKASCTSSHGSTWDSSFYADTHTDPEYDPTSPVDAWDQYLEHLSDIRKRESAFRLPPFPSNPPITWNFVPVGQEPSILAPLPSPPISKPEPILSTEELKMRWKMMRRPFTGHTHNYFCPSWQAGDRRGSTKPECPKDKTFNLFDRNPFTKAGSVHWERLAKRDMVERSRWENKTLRNVEDAPREKADLHNKSKTCPCEIAAEINQPTRVR